MNDEIKEIKEIEGIVEWYNSGLCYGFIKSGDTSYFVSCKILSENYIVLLKKDQKVSFIPKQGRKGMFATHVKLIKNN